jgi:hypothetical protein
LTGASIVDLDQLEERMLEWVDRGLTQDQLNDAIEEHLGESLDMTVLVIEERGELEERVTLVEERLDRPRPQPPQATVSWRAEGL